MRGSLFYCLTLATYYRYSLVVATQYYIAAFLPRDAMHKRGLCRHALCQSVCPSVTFVDFVEMNKHIFNFFHHRVANIG